MGLMEKKKLTNSHFCYVIFYEMSPSHFKDLLEMNIGVTFLKYLDVILNEDLYKEAKELIVEKTKMYDTVRVEFSFENDPFVFNKFIDNNFDRTYKICIFEVADENTNSSGWEFKGKTSNVYCNGKPLFFDGEGSMIKNSDN
jgi:hypothetical protein